MPSRFVKSSDPSCDFIIRDRGPQSHPNHTIEVLSTFIPNENRRSDFGDALMKEIPRGAWMFDGEASPKCFRLLPAYLDQAIEIARKHYRHVYKTEGEKVENLITGETFGERRLF